MTTFIFRQVAILYSWLMAILTAHFESKCSSYYNNQNSIWTSMVATIVMSWAY